jgi:hypothetical protein
MGSILRKYGKPISESERAACGKTIPQNNVKEYLALLSMTWVKVNSTQAMAKDLLPHEQY